MADLRSIPESIIQKRIELERIRHVIDLVVDRTQVYASDERDTIHHLRYQFCAELVGRSSRHVVEYPADWWQHLKQRFFAPWMIRRWPVVMTRVVVDARQIFPELKIPGNQHTLYVVEARDPGGILPGVRRLKRKGEEDRKSISDPRVTGVPVETRRLLILKPGEKLDVRSQLPGAIVWIRQPPEFSDEDVARYAELLKREGAVRVKVLPREAPDLDLPRAACEAPTRVSASIREIVAELVEELPGDVREAARGIIEECLSEAGV